MPPPELRTKRERITRFELVRREVLAMLFTAAGLILLSVVSPAPIAPPIKDMAVVIWTMHKPHGFSCGCSKCSNGEVRFCGGFVPLVVLFILGVGPLYLSSTCSGRTGPLVSSIQSTGPSGVSCDYLDSHCFNFNVTGSDQMRSNMNRLWLTIASGALLLTLILAWWVEAQRAEPIALTPNADR